MLTATDKALVVTLEGADADGLAKSKHVIDSHLERLAFREDFKGMAWSASNT